MHEGTDRMSRIAGWTGTARGAVLALVGLLALCLGAAQAQDNRPTIELPPDLDPENGLVIDLASGPVVIEMFPDKAPNHVARIKELTRKGFYNGVIFHRVIDGFMAQTGDPTGTGRGGSPLPDLPAEFNDMAHERGVVSMARASDPNSANSQFFIMFTDATHLDGQYTAWGKVVFGMDSVDRLARGQPPAVPDRMMRVMVLSDIFKAMGVDPNQQAQARAAARPPIEMPSVPADLDINAPVLRNPEG